MEGRFGKFRCALDTIIIVSPKIDEKICIFIGSYINNIFEQVQIQYSIQPKKA
jgi:hypothetical protein